MRQNQKTPVCFVLYLSDGTRARIPNDTHYHLVDDFVSFLQSTMKTTEFYPALNYQTNAPIWINPRQIVWIGAEYVTPDPFFQADGIR